MPITPGNLVQAPWRRTPSSTSRSLAIVSNHLQSSLNVSNLYLVATVPVSSLCHCHHPSPTNSSEPSPSEAGVLSEPGHTPGNTPQPPKDRALQGPWSLISRGSSIYSRKSF